MSLGEEASKRPVEALEREEGDKKQGSYPLRRGRLQPHDPRVGY